MPRGVGPIPEQPAAEQREFVYLYETNLTMGTGCRSTRGASGSGAFVLTDLTQDRGAGGWQRGLAFATGSPQGQQTPGTPGSSIARERHLPLPTGTEDTRGWPGSAPPPQAGDLSAALPRPPATPRGLWAAALSRRERKRQRSGWCTAVAGCLGPWHFPSQAEWDYRDPGVLGLAPLPPQPPALPLHRVAPRTSTG